MRPLTLSLDESEFERLAREAARRGRTPEELTLALVRAGLEEAEDRARGVALVREMAASFGLSEEEGARVAREEIKAMRAALRARRP